jgi:hypothetical protein
MSENRTPTPGKNAWIARPRPYENETVSVERAAANVPDGFTRDVVLSQVIDEPGKGGTNPPRREIRTRMHAADAITLGIHLVENGINAEQRNAEEGAGAQRTPYFEHPAGDDDRRMPEDFARTNLRLLDAALARVQHWQDTHPDVADYRITGFLNEGRKVRSYLRYLSDDTTPDLDAARAELVRSGFFDDEEPAEQRRATARAVGIPEEAVEPGARTGHAATDARLASGEAAQGKVPRLGVYGRYFVTANTSIMVQIASLEPEHVQLKVVDSAADEYPDGIKAPYSELGTWLILDDPSNWVDIKIGHPVAD